MARQVFEYYSLYESNIDFVRVSCSQSRWLPLDNRCVHVLQNLSTWERGGVLVENMTPNQEALGSIPLAAPCCVLEQGIFTLHIHYW